MIHWKAYLNTKVSTEQSWQIWSKRALQSRNQEQQWKQNTHYLRPFAALVRNVQNVWLPGEFSSWVREAIGLNRKMRRWNTQSPGGERRTSIQHSPREESPQQTLCPHLRGSPYPRLTPLLFRGTYPSLMCHRLKWTFLLRAADIC